MIGAYNVENILAALGASLAAGIDPETALRGIEQVSGVPGRFERVDRGAPYAVVVDYAHTDDALEKLLESVRTLTDGRVIFGVARGYHERPTLTAERFVDRPGLGRVYGTGDVVRIGADGTVEFAGRSDHQVKIRGHRIELGEIETALDTHPDVVQSIVVAHERGGGDPNLVAFVVTHAGRSLDGDTARSAVGERLPDAYVPGRFVRLDAFPVTPDGKVDRSRLIAEVDTHLAGTPAPSADAPELDDDTERLVAEIWTNELGRSPGRDENFFDIGGNSLLAMRVISRLRDTFDVEVAFTGLLDDPTVAGLGKLVETLRWARDGDSADPSPDTWEEVEL